MLNWLLIHNASVAEGERSSTQCHLLFISLFLLWNSTSNWIWSYAYYHKIKPTVSWKEQLASSPVSCLMILWWVCHTGKQRDVGLSKEMRLFISSRSFSHKSQNKDTASKWAKLKICMLLIIDHTIKCYKDTHVWTFMGYYSYIF